MATHCGHLTAVMAAASLSLLPLPSGSQPATNLRDHALNGVVMIRGTTQRGGVTGAGIIVGVTGQDVYIATAKHVVNDETQGKATTIDVQFNARRGEWYPAALIDREARGRDIAALRVLLPAGLSVQQVTGMGSAPRHVLSRGSDVHAAGHALQQAWSTNVAPDKVSSVGRDAITIQSLFVDRGFSGGPLLDNCGRVIGMVIDSTGREAEALPIDLVVDVLDGWGLPVSLVGVRPEACPSARPPTGAREPARTATPASMLADPPILWVRGEWSPLAGGTGGDAHATACPAGAGLVGLRGTTAEANTPGVDAGIEWIWDLQFTCAPLIPEQVSPTRYEFRTGPTSPTDRIGGGGGREAGPIQCPADAVVTAFEAESRLRGFGDAEYLNYFVARCGRVALVYAGGTWDVEIVTSLNLAAVGKAHAGGRRTRFSCADGRPQGDGIVTRISAQAGNLVDGVAVGCSRAVVNKARP